MGVGPEYVGVDFFAITDAVPVLRRRRREYPTRPTPGPCRAAHRCAVLQSGVRFRSARSGNAQWLMSSCRLLNPDMPGQSDMLMSFMDITAERKTADKVMFYATHDALTELPNRVSVLRRLRKALAAPDEGDRLRAVLFIDIDDLKSTNDTLGHTAGDDLLRAVAASLRRVVARRRCGGTIGRRRVRRARLPATLIAARTRRHGRATAPRTRYACDHRCGERVDRCQHRRRRSDNSAISGLRTRFFAMPTSRCTRPSGAPKPGRLRRPVRSHAVAGRIRGCPRTSSSGSSIGAKCPPLGIGSNASGSRTARRLTVARGTARAGTRQFPVGACNVGCLSCDGCHGSRNESA